MKRLMLAVIPALAGVLILTTSAFAWQNRIEGRPASLEAGSTGGDYFWHDQDGLHLWTTDPENIDSHYTGTIETDGRFVNVSLQRPENDDRYTDDGAGHISFSFHTQSGIDGLNFEIAGGTQVRLNLQRDGHQTGVDHIFLGEDGVHPDHNAFRVNR